MTTRVYIIQTITGQIFGVWDHRPSAIDKLLILLRDGLKVKMNTYIIGQEKIISK